MDANSQSKVIASGFTIIRPDDQPNIRIKCKDNNHKDWHTLEKFKTLKIMSKSIDYIESESFVVVNPDYPVISKKNALIAVEISKQETKEKCQTAFRSFILRAVFSKVFKETLDFEKEFESLMNGI